MKERASMNFSRKLMELRRKHGYSQEQLADKLDVTRQSVSKWESGASQPELSKLILLSELFEVSIDYLVKDDYVQETAAVSSEAEARIHAKIDTLARNVDTTVYAYTSDTKVFGIPLVSIRFSRDRAPTKKNTARGIIAIGSYAVGVLSIGLISTGVFSIGLLSLGLFALAMVAVGGVAIGVSTFGFIAYGAAALGVYAIGSSAVASKIAVGIAAAGKTTVGLEAKGTFTLLRDDITSRAQVFEFLKLHNPNVWEPFLRFLAFFGL